MPVMLETDVENERILKKFIDGDTIYQLVLEDKMKTDYIEQLHRMCALLYAANTNIDYFPTNFVVHNEEIYYVDFECNDYMEEWNFETIKEDQTFYVNEDNELVICFNEGDVAPMYVGCVEFVINQDAIASIRR